MVKAVRWHIAVTFCVIWAVLFAIIPHPFFFKAVPATHVALIVFFVLVQPGSNKANSVGHIQEIGDWIVGKTFETYQLFYVNQIFHNDQQPTIDGVRNTYEGMIST